MKIGKLAIREQNLKKPSVQSFNDIIYWHCNEQYSTCRRPHPAGRYIVSTHNIQIKYYYLLLF